MLSTLRRALPPSGGIFYHYLAFRFSRTLWLPFTRHVAEWLSRWNPSARELIIFGSSGGYTLPVSFLERFDRVICVEPDPLARRVFRRRFPNVKAEFTADAGLLEPVPKDFEGSSSKRALENLQKFLERYPNAAVLFANVLGQLPLEFPHLSDDIFASHLVAIRSAVKDRQWASYHDILSTWAKPKNQEPFEIQPGPFEVEEFAVQALEQPPIATAHLEVTDHQTYSLSAGGATLCSWWELAPGRYHLIGFFCSKPAASALKPS